MRQVQLKQHQQQRGRMQQHSSHCSQQEHRSNTAATTQPRHESASRGGMALLSSSSQVTPNTHRAQHAFVPWHSAIFFRSLRKQRTNRSVAHLLCWIRKGRRRAKDTKSFAIAVEVICHKLQGSGGEISNDGIKRSCTRVVLIHYYISNNVAFDTADSAEVRLKMLRSIQRVRF